MTADVAIIAMAVVSLAAIADNHWFRMKVADRVRLVNPVKPPARAVPEAGTAAPAVDLDRARRAG